MNPVPRIASVALALGFAACTPAPRAPMQAQISAVAALRSAEAMGADEDPRAAYHVAVAHERLHAALLLIEEEEPEAAALHLESARIHAELAIALTREGEAVAGGAAGELEAPLDEGLEERVVTASYR